MISVRLNGCDLKPCGPLFSTDELVACPKPGYFIGRIVPSHTGSTGGNSPFRLYVASYAAIMDVEHPESTWMTGSAKTWEVLKWVNVAIDVVGECD